MLTCKGILTPPKKINVVALASKRRKAVKFSDACEGYLLYYVYNILIERMSIFILK